MDDSRILKEKVADSKISEYVWTGHKPISFLPFSTLVGLIKIKFFIESILAFYKPLTFWKFDSKPKMCKIYGAITSGLTLINEIHVRSIKIVSNFN